MEIVIALLIFGGFIVLFFGGLYKWAQHQTHLAKRQFALNSQVLGFSLAPPEAYRTLEAILTALPGWQDKNVKCRAASFTDMDEVKVHLLICEQDGRRIALQFAIALFSSPTMNLPSFQSRPKRPANELTEGGWLKGLHLAGAGQYFICFYQTPKQPDKESLDRLVREGWQHLQAHKTAVSQQMSR